MTGKTAEEQEQIIVGIGHIFNTLTEELRSVFKHPGFYEEKEWRLVITKDLYDNLDSLFFRTSSTSIIPYTELRYPITTKCPLLPILKVIQGPAANKDFNKVAIIALLTKHNYEHVEIEDSTVPLRS